MTLAEKGHATHKSFYVLRQDGILGVPDTVRLGPAGVSNKYKTETPSHRAKSRSAVYEVYQLLGIRSSLEIPQLISNPQMRRQKKERANELFGKMYDIPLTGELLEAEIQRYGEIANKTVNDLISSRLAREKGGSRFETANEVQLKNDPVDLALIMLDDSWDKRVRFEAKRKLILMKLAAAVAQRERRTRTIHKYNDFIDFLDENVWSRNEKKGAPDQEYLLSTHDPESLKALTVVKIDDEISPGYLQMITPIATRRFNYNGEEIAAYIKPREKDPEAQVRKLLIKDQKNPDRAVDDETGLMVVLSSKEDINKFKKHLIASANKAGSAISFEDEEDTLTGEGHEIHSKGSSEKTPMHKFHARVNGIRVEIMLHTNESYINYLYEQGVAHDEYDVNRLFDSGVVCLLFPPEIYNYNESELKRAAIGRVRRNLRSHINMHDGEEIAYV